MPKKKQQKSRSNIWHSTSTKKTNELIVLTFTFKALSVETPQQAATVVTERGALVVIVLEAMRHINIEALFLELQTHRGPLTHTA